MLGFQEQEKCRVLEEALNVLAKEHHELEQSLASGGNKSRPRTPRFYDTSDDEFYDAFEAGSYYRYEKKYWSHLKKVFEVALIYKPLYGQS